MSNELILLIITAASLGFIHTLAGPDHYVPFIAMAKARKWPMPKAIWITVLCGVGHIGSSVILGLIGVAFGLAVAKIEPFEAFRGNIAGWALIAFGLVYCAWGIRQAVKNKPHTHLHFHPERAAGESKNPGEHMHEHSHAHKGEHSHAHEKEGKANITPWILFTIFVFGPCEPLIPILMYPAAKGSMFALIMVTAVFGLVTIATMLGMVLVTLGGLSVLRFSKIERYAHAIAGFTILLCGAAIQFLGM